MYLTDTPNRAIAAGVSQFPSPDEFIMISLFVNYLFEGITQ